MVNENVSAARLRLLQLVQASLSTFLPSWSRTTEVIRLRLRGVTEKLIHSFIHCRDYSTLR